MFENPCFQYIDDIAKVTGQYFKDMNLHFFGHITVYPDGKYSFLCSGHDWPRAHFSDQKIPPAGFTIYDKIVDSVIFPSMDKGSDFGWTDEVTIESKERFGILNPMIIMRKYEDHYQGFFFDLHCENVYEKYVNHFDLFEKFTHYHKDASRKMIEKASKNPLMVDPQYIPQKIALPDLELGASFLGETNNQRQPKKYFLRHNNIDVPLSPKEYYSLSLLAHGRQFKSIAEELKVSTRTIETHFERIKKKLNLSNREEIAAVYWKSRILLGNPLRGDCAA